MFQVITLILSSFKQANYSLDLLRRVKFFMDVIYVIIINFKRVNVSVRCACA